jgi:cobalt-zinc-cadmium efflux system outer membrane protein
MNRTISLLFAALLPAMQLAAQTAGDKGRAERTRVLGRELATFPPPSEVAAAAPAAPEEPTGALTLRAALTLVLAHNPELAAFSWRVRASEARVLQAGRWPNPEAELTLEDIGGSGEFSGIGQAQTTLELNQLVELGGKRAARVRETSLARDVTAWDYEAKRLELFTDTAQAFVQVVGAQEDLVLAKQAAGLAQQVLQTATRRLTAGSASPAEATKAKVALASAEIERGQARQRLEIARQQLAAQWGSVAPRFTMAEGALDVVERVPPLKDLLPHLTENPDLARWASELAQRRATIALEESRTIPNVTAGVGYRRLSGPDRNVAVVSLSVPLPLLNRNDGAILEARRRLAEGTEEQRAAEVRLTAALVATHWTLATTHDQVTALREQVLPNAKRAFETLTDGYREGRFSYLDVLDAQRTLIAARLQYVRVLVDYHMARAEVQRLTGEPLRGASEGERETP